jgi:multiple sugar transport system ATP-binding protein
MSGGQRQRVAVGRAIVRKPEVFLFDEPLSNLDAKLRVSMRVRITQLHKELKEAGQPATMIYVTHDQVEAMTMGDRICVLEYGVIKQVDTPINLYNRPANRFVAGFIGSPSMNIISSELIQDGDKIGVKVGDTILHLPKEKAEKVKDYVGKPVWFGIRPEHIGSHETHPGKEEYINGKISIVEQMGNEEFIYFTIDGVQYTARLNSENVRETGNGKNYDFWFDMEKCHIFDKETDENISLV